MTTSSLPMVSPGAHWLLHPISWMAIAHWLCSQSRVKEVLYAELETHPGFKIMKRQATGFGAMISFEVDSETTAKRVLEKVALIQYAESLGGIESLITYPMLQTHADISEAEREAKGIHNRLLRLSVGLENVHDLIEDLKGALE